MNSITSYATMLRHESQKNASMVAPIANDEAQVAAILTNLSTIAEKEFYSRPNGRTETHQLKKHHHPLLGAEPPATPIASNISLESYLQSCRLKKPRAVSIEYTTNSSDPSYLAPQATMAAASLIRQDSIVSPLSVPSALVTPSSSPVLGTKVLVRPNLSTTLPRVISDLSPEAIADSVAHAANGVKPVVLSAGFKASNQVPNLFLTKKSKPKQHGNKNIAKKSTSIKIAPKKRQPKNVVPARDGSNKMLIMKRFCWRDFPELENILISNRREYLSFSSRNYSPTQKKFNNNLTATVIKTAEECGYKFSPQHFDFSSVRDRIRCYYKSYVQGEKKRLFSALAAAASAEESRAIKKEIAFLDSRSSGTRKS